MSIFEHSFEEALRFKWIESEKAGHDLGVHAMRSWIHQHWNGYLRARWIEHILGVTYWIELNHDDFGLLTRQYRDSPYLASIVEQLMDRGENLSILNWAIDHRLDTREIRRVLTGLDINSWRMECELESRLCDYLHPCF